MYCSKCGASVVGKYCSCCGQRIRSEAEEFNLIENRLRREFKSACAGSRVPLYYAHLAEACWLAATMKYQKRPSETVGFIEAVNSMDQVKYAARDLFNKLKDF